MEFSGKWLELFPNNILEESQKNAKKIIIQPIIGGIIEGVAEGIPKDFFLSFKKVSKRINELNFKGIIQAISKK